MSRKTVPLTAELAAYLLEHSSPVPLVARRLIEETAAMGTVAGMQISPEQGLLLRLLVSVTGARRVLEIGTFTGFSSLMMAYGGAGEVVCLDISEEFTSVARRYWADAGVDHLIDLRIGPAIDSLRRLDKDQAFDFVFIDADKENYLAYFEMSLERLGPKGLIAVDNTLWSGRVLDPSDSSADTMAIKAFNEAVARDDRVETLILPIGDGMTLIRRR
ncbi:MAG TPA: class I SAM-dependent methyltransferase [Acidimicrobiia bacterium]|nr:class I SAM-dependent methyltransferase [Acidimicrobiia bacterium]